MCFSVLADLAVKLLPCEIEMLVLVHEEKGLARLEIFSEAVDAQHHAQQGPVHHRRWW